MNGDNLLACCEAFIDAEDETFKHSLYLTFNQSYYAFIAGLASFKLYRETCDSEWLARGKERVNAMDVLATHGSEWNFRQKHQLLVAELQYCLGNYELANESYKKAIMTAELHRFTNDEAIACECAAVFFVGKGDLPLAREYYTLAEDAFQRWGAIGKAAQLSAFLNA